MGKKIIVDSNVHQMRIAIVENSELIELFIEEKKHETIVGNIYRGRVKNVLPGMQAIFLDIGQTKNAFLSLSDKKSENSKKIFQGMEMTVQVEKEATGTKGAKVSNALSITGRFVVLLPKQNYIGVSQKIENSQERKRLKNIVKALKPENYGIIIRTNAQGKLEEDLLEEINKLYLKSEKILNTSEYIKSPALIYKDSSLVYRAVRDLFSNEIEEFIINDEQDYKDALEMSNRISNDFSSKVKYYNKQISIFDYYSIETQIEKALQKHVWLKSGGFLVIEQTEACVVIDVNTGKFVGKKNLQETIFKTNKEASIEIAKQIKLRNLSGMIIIDFIDMSLNENQKEILMLLENETKKDRVKTVVIGITELGLVQVTRKKMRESLNHILLDDCFCCHGYGKVASMQWTIQKLYNEIEYIFVQTIFNQVKVYACRELIQAFSGENNKYLTIIENKYNKKIIFQIEDLRQKNYYRIEKTKI